MLFRFVMVKAAYGEPFPLTQRSKPPHASAPTEAWECSFAASFLPPLHSLKSHKQHCWLQLEEARERKEGCFWLLLPSGDSNCREREGLCLHLSILSWAKRHVIKVRKSTKCRVGARMNRLSQEISPCLSKGTQWLEISVLSNVGPNTHGRDYVPGSLNENRANALCTPCLKTLTVSSRCCRTWFPSSTEVTLSCLGWCFYIRYVRWDYSHDSWWHWILKSCLPRIASVRDFLGSLP